MNNPMQSEGDPLGNQLYSIITSLRSLRPNEYNGRASKESEKTTNLKDDLKVLVDLYKERVEIDTAWQKKRNGWFHIALVRSLTVISAFFVWAFLAAIAFAAISYGILHFKMLVSG